MIQIFVGMMTYCIIAIALFPGGPKGFWYTTKAWLNRKK